MNLYELVRRYNTMTARPTDAIVADLREISPPHSALSLLVQASRVSPPLRKAVAEVEAWINDCWKDLQGIDALRPDCPTCDPITDCPRCGDDAHLTFPSALAGEPDFHEYECTSCGHSHKHCDGKVSVAQLAATWRAVQDPSVHVFEKHLPTWQSAFDYLRAVRP